MTKLCPTLWALATQLSPSATYSETQPYKINYIFGLTYIVVTGVPFHDESVARERHSASFGYSFAFKVREVDCLKVIFGTFQ